MNRNSLIFTIPQTIIWGLLAFIAYAISFPVVAQTTPEMKDLSKVEESPSGEATLAKLLAFYRSISGMSIKYTLKREFPQDDSLPPLAKAVHLISAGEQFIARLTRIIDEKENKLGETEILAYDGTFYQDYTDRDRSLIRSLSPMHALYRLLKSCPLTAPCDILSEEDKSNRFPLQLLTSLEFPMEIPKRIGVSKVVGLSPGKTLKWENSEASYSIISEIFPVMTKYSEDSTWRTVTVISWRNVKIAGREMAIPEAILYEGHARSGHVICESPLISRKMQ